jgi:hypothetical protein
MPKMLIGFLLISGLAAGQTATAPDAAARRQFAETVRQKVIKERGSALSPGYNLTADGPDATFYVYNDPGITYSDCSGMLTEDFVANLRRYGFTQLVCTDSGNNARFSFDLTVPKQSRPVENPDMQRAISYAKVLQSQMRDPDSFVLEAVYLKPNRNVEPNICYQYRSKNGYGGYSSGLQVLTAGKNPRWLDAGPSGASWNDVYCRPANKLVDITNRVKTALAEQFLMPQRKLYAQATVDGMAALFPNARVTVTDTHVAFYDDNADSRMCSIVKTGGAVLRTVGATDMTVSNKMGEVCRFDLTQ